MATVQMTPEQMRAENLELRRKLREAQLQVQGLRGVLGDCASRTAGIAAMAKGAVRGEEALRSAIRWQKLDKETYLRKAVGSENGVAADKIDDALAESLGGIVTVEDLQFLPRATVAGIRGVGPKAMSAMDAAFEERGLTWRAD